MTWHAEFMKSLRINMCSWSKHIPSQQSAVLDWEQATAQHTQPGAQRLAQLWGSSREGFQMKSPILRAKEFIYFKSVCFFFFFNCTLTYARIFRWLLSAITVTPGGVSWQYSTAHKHWSFSYTKSFISALPDPAKTCFGKCLYRKKKNKCWLEAFSWTFCLQVWNWLLVPYPIHSQTTGF